MALLAHPYVRPGPSHDAGSPPGGPLVPSRPALTDDQPDASRTLTWLRVVKLVLSIVLLVLAILEAVARFGPA